MLSPVYTGTAGVLRGELSTRVPADGRTQYAGHIKLQGSIFYMEVLLWKLCFLIQRLVLVLFEQCCGAGAGRSRTFWLEQEPVKKLRLRAVAVWLWGTVVAK